MEPGVGVDDADHRHPGEIEPLGDHLRAQQDVHLAARHTLEDAVMAPLSARGVEIHAYDAGGGKPQPEIMLELLGPEAPHAPCRRPAVLAARAERLLVAAVVAAKRARRRVDGERDGAARAA